MIDVPSLEPADLTEPAPPPPDLDRFHFVDWGNLWRSEPTEDWMVEPLLARGRSTAIVAAAKTGKSLLLADIAAAVATGGRLLGRPNPHPAVPVLYLDYEMTSDDLFERLADMGYGPEIDLGKLHYALLPSIEPLDREVGGRQVLDAASQIGAQLVIIDTVGRAVEGAEDSADTFRAFYQYTAMLLKRAGVTVVRADHVGHGAAIRARGSSAKADDVDVVWAVKATDDGIVLDRTHSRISWVPPRVTVNRLAAPLRHVIPAGAAWPAGTYEVAGRLDELGVDLSIGVTAAMNLLRAQSPSGKGSRKQVVAAALRLRRERSAGEWPVPKQPSRSGAVHRREPLDVVTPPQARDLGNGAAGTAAGTGGNRPTATGEPPWVSLKGTQVVPPVVGPCSAWPSPADQRIPPSFPNADTPTLIK